MIGLINRGNWQEINFFETEPDQFRGSHYHKNTDELFVILKGKIKIQLSKVSEKGVLIGKTQYVHVSKGDVFIIPKLTFHIFEILQQTEWINALSIKLNNNNPDIYPLK
ncbi:cupin domain-containing protein [Flavobacteriaceae bacterium]|nr:cupin domain-containing protein [Flavobacteriaceae bacterium]